MPGILQQPYPQDESLRRDLAATVLAGLFVFGFLWLFQPFGIGNWHHPRKVWYLAGYGLVTLAAMGFDLILVKRLFPRFFAEPHWTVGKTIGWTLFILMTVTVGNNLYASALGFGESGRGFSLYESLLTTFSVGIFPSVLIPLGNYVYHLRKYTAAVTMPQGGFRAGSPFANDPPGNDSLENIRAGNSIPENSILGNPQTPALVELVAENGRDRLSVPLPDLLFIESSDNYSTVFFIRNGKPAKELIRGSLSRWQTQIAAPEVVRCHRSYIVNTGRIRAVSGNAQGYKLHLHGCETPVPVARKYSQIVTGR